MSSIGFSEPPTDGPPSDDGTFQYFSKRLILKIYNSYSIVMCTQAPTQRGPHSESDLPVARAFWTTLRRRLHPRARRLNNRNTHEFRSSVRFPTLYRPSWRGRETNSWRVSVRARSIHITDQFCFEVGRCQVFEVFELMFKFCQVTLQRNLLSCTERMP